MRSLFEFLSTSVKPNIIHATDNTIKKIVKDELDSLRHDADLNHIDVSDVTNMDSLFSCSDDDLGSDYKDLNPDISRWDVSKVKNMNYMFYKCEKFNQDISQWDVSQVKNMHSMFFECENFNQDISQWDISKAENMASMFFGCKNFNKDLSQWDLSNVLNMSYMFNNCIKMPVGHFPKAWVHHMSIK